MIVFIFATLAALVIFIPPPDVVLHIIYVSDPAVSPVIVPVQDLIAPAAAIILHSSEPAKGIVGGDQFLSVPEEDLAQVSVVGLVAVGDQGLVSGLAADPDAFLFAAVPVLWNREVRRVSVYV